MGRKSQARALTVFGWGLGENPFGKQTRWTPRGGVHQRIALSLYWTTWVGLPAALARRGSLVGGKAPGDVVIKVDKRVAHIKGVRGEPVCFRHLLLTNSFLAVCCSYVCSADGRHPGRIKPATETHTGREKIARIHPPVRRTDADRYGCGGGSVL